MPTLYTQRPPLGISVAPLRLVRACSIPIAAADTVVGQHRFNFTNITFFEAFSPAPSPPQLLSNAHGNIGSGYVFTGFGSGKQGYFNGSGQNENVQNVFSPPDQAGQSVQIPGSGVMFLSFSLFLYSSLESDLFKFEVMRTLNPDDAVAFAGAPALQSVPVWSSGAIKSLATGDQHPNMVSMDPIRLPSATSLSFKLSNLSSAVNVNWVLGDVFLHG